MGIRLRIRRSHAAADRAVLAGRLGGLESCEGSKWQALMPDRVPLRLGRRAVGGAVVVRMISSTLRAGSEREALNPGLTGTNDFTGPSTAP
jgi:hypothetical protein